MGSTLCPEPGDWRCRANNKARLAAKRQCVIIEVGARLSAASAVDSQLSRLLGFVWLTSLDSGTMIIIVSDWPLPARNTELVALRICGRPETGSRPTRLAEQSAHAR